MGGVHHPLDALLSDLEGKSDSPVAITRVIGKDGHNLFLEEEVICFSFGVVVSGGTDKPKDPGHQDDRYLRNEVPDERKECPSIFF